MSLGCAVGSCGDCCNPVKIDFATWARAVGYARSVDPEQIADEDRGYWADAVFLASRCRPVGARNGQVLLECVNWDGEHARCMDYERRPPVCRGFPWYGRDPGDDDNAFEGRCSFLLDAPPDKRPEGARPLIPVTVVSR